MSRTARDSAPPNPRHLTIILSLLVVLGIAATGASIVAAQTSSAASRADVERTRTLVEQIADLQRDAEASRQEHREFNQADHNCIIALAILLADPERDRTKPVEPPCRAATLPDGVETPVTLDPTPTPGG